MSDYDCYSSNNEDYYNDIETPFNDVIDYEDYKKGDIVRIYGASSTQVTAKELISFHKFMSDLDDSACDLVGEFSQDWLDIKLSDEVENDFYKTMDDFMSRHGFKPDFEILNRGELISVREVNDQIEVVGHE